MGCFQKEAKWGLSIPNSKSSCSLFPYVFCGQTGRDVCLSAIAQGQAEFPRSAVLGTHHLSREIGGGGGVGLSQWSDCFPSLCILL